MYSILMCGPESDSGGVATHMKYLNRELQNQGLNIIVYKIKGNIIFKLYQRTLGLMIKILRNSSEIDLIHVQASGGIFSFVSALTGVCCARLLKKIPIIITFHHSDSANFVKRHPFVFNYVLSNSNKMIFVTQIQMNSVIELGNVYHNKCMVIPNGYPSDIYYPRDILECRKKLHLSGNQQIIFNISNIIPIKGHKHLINAFSVAIKKNPNILLFIAGEGSQKNDLIKYVNERGLHNQVFFLGWIPEEQIPIWLNACDLFVHPSLAESFGIVVLQAFACGKPVISTINGGSEELIVSDNLGFLCKPANEYDMAEKINLALQKKWENDMIYDNSKKFEWAEIGKKTYQLYESVIKNNRKRK